MQTGVGSGARVRCQPAEGRSRIQEVQVGFFRIVCHAMDCQFEGFGCSGQGTSYQGKMPVR
jgi:hypothetical protein